MLDILNNDNVRVGGVNCTNSMKILLLSFFIQISFTDYFKKVFIPDKSYDSTDGNTERSAKRWNSMMEAETRLARETPQVTLSQPIMANPHTSIMQALDALKTPKKDQICFSQPTHNDDLMIQLTQSPVTKENFHNLVKRMTRFYVNTSVKNSLEILCSALDTLHYTWAVDPSGGVS